MEQAKGKDLVPALLLSSRLATIVIAVLAGLVTMPSAAANTPHRESTTYFNVICELHDETAGPIQFFVDQDLDGRFGSVSRWEPGADPNTDAPVLVSEGVRIDVAGTDPVLAQGELFLVDSNHRPAGTATFELEVISAGEPVLTGSSLPGRKFNIVTMVELIIAQGEVSGRVNFPDGVGYDLSGKCSATLGTQSIVETRPRAIAGQDEPFSSADCSVENAGRTLSTYFYGGERLGSVEMSVAPYGSVSVIVGMADVDITRGRLVAVVPMTTLQGDPIGNATIDAVLVDQAREHVTEIVQGVRFRRISDLYMIAGEVRLPDGSTIPLEDCEASSSRGWIVAKGPRGRL